MSCSLGRRRCSGRAARWPQGHRSTLRLPTRCRRFPALLLKWSLELPLAKAGDAPPAPTRALKGMILRDLWQDCALACNTDEVSEYFAEFSICRPVDAHSAGPAGPSLPCLVPAPCPKARQICRSRSVEAAPAAT